MARIQKNIKKGDDNVLKDKVKSLCVRKGISISKLEEECEIGHGTILKWDKSAPTLKTVKKVADYFGVTMCELVGDYDG